MNLLCLFPIADIAKYKDNIPKILESFNKIKDDLITLGATSIQINWASANYLYVPNNESITWPGKGKGVLDCLKSCNPPPDYVICCDGSGAIPYEYIVNIFQELSSDPNAICVMSNRVGEKGISNFRYLVERFEVFMIKKHNKKEEEDIPDGQCGLWGYKLGRINLTAIGYELELDLLGEVLRYNLNYSFVDINLPPREVPSQFSLENNIKKMQFFLNKYPNLKDCILSYILEFEKTEEFKELIKKVKKDDNEWEPYKKSILGL